MAYPNRFFESGWDAHDPAASAPPRYRFSDPSDSLGDGDGNGDIASHLGPPEPFACQTDVCYNSTWLEPSAHRIDSALCNSATSESDVQQGFDFGLGVGLGHGSNPVQPSFAHGDPDISATDWSNSVLQEYQPRQSSEFPSAQIHQPRQNREFHSADQPWYPGSRLSSTHGSRAQHYHQVGNCQSNIALEQHVPAIKFEQYQAPSSQCGSSQFLDPPPSYTESESQPAKLAFQSESDGTTKCPHCDALFTGRYRRGNCSRHIRQQHDKKHAKPKHDCICRICDKEFKRQDARRKHEWKKHKLLDARPNPRQQVISTSPATSHVCRSERYSSSASSTYAHTITTTQPRFTVPAPSHPAHSVFEACRKQLDTEEYDKLCETFWVRWEAINNGLRDKQSDACDSFTRTWQGILKELLLAHDTDSHALLATCGHRPSDAPTGHDEEQHGKSVSKQDRGKAPATTQSSRAVSRYAPYGTPLGRKSSSGSSSPMIVIADKFDLPECQELDCPVHKMHVANNLLSPCGGCGQQYPKGVRQHLSPQYSKKHEGHIAFIKRCERCKDDIVDQQTWFSEGHEPGTCLHKRLPRSPAGIIVWFARLYLKIYPREARVPSPYKNDRRFLPVELVDLVRNDLGFIMPVDELGRINSSAQYRCFSEKLKEQASLDTLLNDVVQLHAKLLAQKQVQVHQDQRSLEDVEAEWRARLDRLQRQHAPMTDRTQQTRLTDTFYQEALNFPSGFQQVQVPILGGADDFSAPHQIADAYPNMAPRPGSDMGTQPTSQDYLTHGLISDHPSFNPSSHTSFDARNDQVLLSPAQDPISAYPPKGWVSPLDDTLEGLPGPSRANQLHATRVEGEAFPTEYDGMLSTQAPQHYSPSMYGTFTGADFDDDLNENDFNMY